MSENYITKIYRIQEFNLFDSRLTALATLTKLTSAPAHQFQLAELHIFQSSR